MQRLLKDLEIMLSGMAFHAADTHPATSEGDARKGQLKERCGLEPRTNFLFRLRNQQKLVRIRFGCGLDSRIYGMFTARNESFQNMYLFCVLFTDSLRQMVDPCGVYLDSSSYIDISHVFVTETNFSAMICQPLDLCPVQNLDCSVGKFAMHSGSTDIAEVLVCPR